MEMKELFDKAKKVGFINLEPAEQEIIKPRIVQVMWKHEGRSGPVWVGLNDKEHDEFMNQEIMVSFPYDLSEYQPEDGDHVFAKWFTEEEAEDLADSLYVEFETC
jgi:hypothetical protein